MFRSTSKLGRFRAGSVSSEGRSVGELLDLPKAPESYVSDGTCVDLSTIPPGSPSIGRIW